MGGTIFLGGLILIYAITVILMAIVSFEEKAIDSFIIGLIPIIGTVILLDNNYDEHDKIKKFFKRFKRPNLGTLSTQAKIEIKIAEDELKDQIVKLKSEHKKKVEQIKRNDEKRLLLDKLGLTFDDLEKIKKL